MSVKTKGINMEKVIATFEKADIDEKIRGFEALRLYIEAELKRKAQELEQLMAKMERG